MPNAGTVLKKKKMLEVLKKKKKEKKIVVIKHCSYKHPELKCRSQGDLQLRVRFSIQ